MRKQTERSWSPSIQQDGRSEGRIITSSGSAAERHSNELEADIMDESMLEGYVRLLPKHRKRPQHVALCASRTPFAWSSHLSRAFESGMLP